MIVPLFVGREKSIKALEEVMRTDGQILLATQKTRRRDEPSVTTFISRYACAQILQLSKIAWWNCKSLVEAERVQKFQNITERNDFYEAEAKVVEDEINNPVEVEALSVQQLAILKTMWSWIKKSQLEVVAKFKSNDWCFKIGRYGCLKSFHQNCRKGKIAWKP